MKMKKDMKAVEDVDSDASDDEDEGDDDRDGGSEENNDDDEEDDSGDDEDDSGGDEEEDDDLDAAGDMFPRETTTEKNLDVTNGDDVKSAVVDDKEEEEENEEKEEPSSKRRRLTKSITSEEARDLKEADTSLSANLFKFQTQEMLKEIKVDDEWNQKIRGFVDRVAEILTTTMATATPSKMMQHISEVEGIPIPFRSPISPVGAMGGSFAFAPPASIFVDGCFRLGVACKPNIVVDVAVEMPSSIFEKKDFSNLRYAFKRAVYLAHVASLLKKEESRSRFRDKGDDIVDMRFEWEAVDDPLRTRLILKPEWSVGGEDRKLKIAFSLFCFADENSHLRIDKLAFANSLVDAEWFFGGGGKAATTTTTEDLPSKDPPETATFYAAHYENDLLRDLTFRRNSDFLQTIFARCPHLRDGVTLLRTWMRQRGVDRLVGAADGDVVLLASIAFLFNSKVVTKDLSSVQIFRKTLIALSNDVFENGVDLAEEEEEAAAAASTTESHSRRRRRRLAEFFDVVVLDRTGSCNLTPFLSKLTLRQLGREARAGLACLDGTPHSKDAFEGLFLHRYPDSMKFDQIFVVENDSRGETFKRIVKDKNLQVSVFRDSGATLPCVRSFLLQLLVRAFGTRVESITPLAAAAAAYTNHQWSLLEKSVTSPPTPPTTPPPTTPPPTDESAAIRIGVHLDVAGFSAIIDRGPALERVDDVDDFRRFWGSRCQTRRFKDASIVEAVNWFANSADMRRRINFQIFEHILKTHLALKVRKSEDGIWCIGDHLPRDVFRFKQKRKDKHSAKTKTGQKKKLLGTGEEEQNICLTAFDELSKILRSLSRGKETNALPLRITSVQGISPVFRQTDPFPPLPSFYGQSNSVTKTLVRGTTVALGKEGAQIDDQLGDRIPDDGENVDGALPAWVPSLKVSLTLELSGKWPEDLEAVYRIKSSFLTTMSKCLQDAKLSTSLTKNSIKVLKDGFVFELSIAHPRELALLKRIEESEEQQQQQRQHSSTSAVFRRRHFTLPHVSSVINGLNAQYPAFSVACRLFKRWVASQLLLDFFDEEGVALELLVAYTFLHPQPYAVAAAVSPQTAFLRVLQMVSTWSWESTPIIVNFNEELTPKEYRKLHRRLTSVLAQRRASSSASTTTESSAMFIATPYDKDVSEWTVFGPPNVVLSRLVAVAKASFEVLVDFLDADQRFGECPAFSPPLDGFNVLIHLRKSKLPKKAWSYGWMEAPEALTTHSNPRNKGLMPVNDFDPARSFLEDLRRSYKDVCYFFHDPYGGQVIGVLWRPEVLRPRPLEIDTSSSSTIRSKGGMRFVDKTVGDLTGDAIEDLGRVETHVEFNVEAFVEDVQILGEGLVSKVEVKTENWI